MIMSDECLEIVVFIVLAIFTSISFAWIEAGINKISFLSQEKEWKILFYEPKILNHFAVYHLAMAVLALSINFSYFFIKIKRVIFKKEYWPFLFSLGNFFFWVALEDNMAMFFMKEPYTETSWTNWFFGATKFWFGWFPNWIILAYSIALICWSISIWKVKKRKTN
jgi:hypothetical protein